MLSLLLLCLLFSYTQCSCPDKFELVRNGECRGLYATTSTIPDNQLANAAVSKCKEIQGLPPIIRDDFDQSYWLGLVDPSNKPYFVLGIVCNVNTNQWKWADGSNVDYRPAKYDTSLNSSCSTGYVWELYPDGEWHPYTATHSYDDNIFCTTQLPPLPVPSPDGCESFEDDNEDGVCYQVGENAENWQAAQMSCRNFGGDLASIHSLQENSFIRRLAVSKGAVDGLFLGATISGKGKEFGWIDGSEWDYDYFYPSFPLDGQGDCLAMDTLGITGQWVNKNCSSSMPFACVNRQSHSAPVCSGPWKEGQIITSPGYPFDASTPCEFILTVEAGKNVELEVVLLEANSCCDHVILTDDFVGGTIIANLTGEISNKIYATKSSNLMRVSWQPNGGVNVRGMMMTFRGV